MVDNAANVKSAEGVDCVDMAAHARGAESVGVGVFANMVVYEQDAEIVAGAVSVSMAHGEVTVPYARKITQFLQQVRNEQPPDEKTSCSG
uniref:Uncharacterized protein n=1 Tax=Chromera velia CCMP2878 TaxID=1169474 RepID=A0A0G4H5Z1_9ALVE|eukprot:Cvel_24832.t1-p1 / transcript=Cvel_24832.t1 / gene=Cvel_24832 / organism=Chromera_velia_CCMP2878 / gene_product=hypothetical protein / transcript_product=hypothetical protein / location=Cvel_scaffold2738:21663-21929(+) / protein_length=89 / sequence_SO=supercontig / SO=protein_coding / is_pseudo=false